MEDRAMKKILDFLKKHWQAIVLFTVVILTGYYYLGIRGRSFPSLPSLGLSAQVTSKISPNNINIFRNTLIISEYIPQEDLVNGIVYCDLMGKVEDVPFVISTKFYDMATWEKFETNFANTKSATIRITGEEETSPRLIGGVIGSTQWPVQKEVTKFEYSGKTVTGIRVFVNDPDLIKLLKVERRPVKGSKIAERTINMGSP